MFCKPQDQQQFVTVSKSKCSVLTGARCEPHPKANAGDRGCSQQLVLALWAAEDLSPEGSACFQQGYCILSPVEKK